MSYALPALVALELFALACQGSPGSPGPAGDAGPPGYGYVPLDPTGVVGFVRDTAHDPVVNAKVYLVPSTDIPIDAIDLSSIAAARSSVNDEPLEDTIAAKGSA